MEDERKSGPSDPGAAGEIDTLTRELVKLARSEPSRVSAILAKLPLRQQAELALLLPAEERLELLLHAPKPMKLVRVLPDAELYLTVRETGPDDALPLLSLASAEQIRHLMDLESWRGDRFDPKRSGAWVAVFLDAGEATLMRFVRNADDDLLALLLQTWLRVTQIELDDTPAVHGSGESERGDERGFVSPDGYHRFSPIIPEHGPAGQFLMQMLFRDQPKRYQQLVWSALCELPSELEENALRWRQSRLEEHGFPQLDEALAVYAPPSGIRVHPQPLEADNPAVLRAPRTLLRVLDDRHATLVPAIGPLSGESRDRVLHEMASLANHLLVADGADAGDPRVHRGVLEKAAGYVGIALSLRGADERETARLFEEIPMVELFREGYALAIELQGHVTRMSETGWASVHDGALELLDPPIRQRIDALRQARPAYVENEFLRDFASLAEIEETRVAVEMAEVVGRLFAELLGLDIGRILAAARDDRPDPPRFSTLLLTLMAWHAVRGELRLDPLSPEVTAGFLRSVASRRTAAPDAAPRAMERLVSMLADKFGLRPRELAMLQAFGRACLEQLAAECANRDPGTPLDPRFVSCLWIDG